MKTESSRLSVHEESKELEEQAAKSFKEDSSSASSFKSGDKSSQFKNTLFGALGPN
jgi:hypothetical protein